MRQKGFAALILILIIAIIGFIGFCLYKNFINSNPKEYISYLNSNGDIYMRDDKYIYSENDKNSFNVKIGDIVNKVPIGDFNGDKNLNGQWINLLEIPKEKAAFYISDIVVSKDGKIVTFVTVQENETSNNMLDEEYKVYVLDYSKNNSPMEIYEANDDDWSYPIIDSISSDGKHISLTIIPCNACGATQPGTYRTLLIRFSDLKNKELGKTAYFKWRQDSSYEYKPVEMVSCQIEAPDGSSFDGECLKNLMEINNIIDIF